jgi:cobalt/nickel transport system permease protein
MAANPAMPQSPTRTRGRRASRRGFFERSIGQFMEGLERANHSESVSSAGGLLQHLSPRAKLFSVLLLVCGVVAARSLAPIGAILALSIGLALASQIRLSFLIRFVWLGVFGLSGLIAIPALFLTPGAIVYRLPFLGWSVTDHGLHVTSLLLLRTETTATLLVLLVLTTPWMDLLRSLRALRVPKVLVALVGMTYRYVFLLLELSLEMFESRRSRIVAPLRGAERRKLVAATAGVLLSKSAAMSEEVFNAMQARGYRGDVYLLDAAPARSHDWVAISLSIAGTAMLIWR